MMDHSDDTQKRPDSSQKRANGDDYEVGYGKPPKHGQFQPGRSGNPKGRPKGAKSLKGHLLDQLNHRVTINEGGRSRNITIREAIAKRMTEVALRGDLKTIMQMFALDVAQADEANRQGEEELTHDELTLLEGLMAGSSGDVPRSATDAGQSDAANTDATVGEGERDDD